MGLPLFKTPHEIEPSPMASMEKSLSNRRSSIRRNRFRPILRLDAHENLNTRARRSLGSNILLESDHNDVGRTANSAFHVPNSESTSRSWSPRTLRILDHERERTRLRDCLSFENQRSSNSENRTPSIESGDYQRQSEPSSINYRIRPIRTVRRGIALSLLTSRSILTDERFSRLSSSMPDVVPNYIDTHVHDQGNILSALSVPDPFENDINGTSISRRHPLLHFAFHQTRNLSQLTSRIEGHPLNIPSTYTNEYGEYEELCPESEDSWDNTVTNSNLSDIQQYRENSTETVITAPRAIFTNSSEPENTEKNDGSITPADYATDPRIEADNEEQDCNENGDGISQSLVRRNPDRSRPFASILAAREYVTNYAATTRLRTFSDWSNTLSIANEADDILEDWWDSVG